MISTIINVEALGPFLLFLFVIGIDDSLHARLNSHYKAWCYEKKKEQKD